MSPRSDAQFEAIRQKSRQAILKAALRLFARQGYSETTTADIARRVGISTGLIYNYFSSKQEILECLIMESIATALPGLVTQDTLSDPKDQLEQLIRQWFRLIKSDSDLVRLSLQLHIAGEFRTLIRRKGREHYDKVSAGLKGIFQRLGSGHPDLDALLFFNLFDGISLNFTAAPQFFPVEQMEERLIQIYCGREGKVR